MELMDTADKSRALRTEKNQPATERQRLPWHTPKLIKPVSVESLTGSHHKSSGGDYHPYTSSVS
jgi:hypothetical protein